VQVRADPDELERKKPAAQLLHAKFVVVVKVASDPVPGMTYPFSQEQVVLPTADVDLLGQLTQVVPEKKKFSLHLHSLLPNRVPASPLFTKQELHTPGVVPKKPGAQVPQLVPVVNEEPDAVTKPVLQVHLLLPLIDDDFEGHATQVVPSKK